jgi:hypothetical protein
MDNQPHGSAKQELIERLKAANNILVTVSRNPSVDQLAACIGLGLLLNREGKHTAAVFSGKIPSTLEFLQPEDTLEKNTDSLRDFIISLDKSKADKLRYKVEDDVVRIFITPYKTSISQEDLEFSQGDFNVDLVVALGVNRQEDLDEAITAHGRILHDATVAAITTSPEGELGSINWQDPMASSLCELVTELVQMLNGELLDGQIATALLTGIVAETERFSNNKTAQSTMSASAALMGAGANQQLVATQLDQPVRLTPAVDSGQEEDNAVQRSDDGAIRIEHAGGEEPTEPALSIAPPDAEAPDPVELPTMPEAETPSTEAPTEQPESESPPEQTPDFIPEHSRRILEPPTLGGTLTANSGAERPEPTTDPFSMPVSESPQLLERDKPSAGPGPVPEPTAPPVPEPVAPPEPEAVRPPVWTPPPTPVPEPVASNQAQTLADIEQKVKGESDGPDDASGQQPEPPSGLDDAREEVNKALGTSDSPAEPATETVIEPEEPAAPSLEEQIPGLKVPGEAGSAAPEVKAPEVKDPNAPPPVPPPFMPTQTPSDDASHPK